MFATIAVSFALGVASWSFAEYALHNWYGHVAKGRNEFSREHLLHHARYLYFTSTAKKALSVVAAMALAIPVAVLVLGAVSGLSFVAGLLGFYVTYEVLHYRAHTRPPRGRYGRWLRKHHFYHHFGNPKLNHGVTSPIWDIVFRTHAHPDKVRVPRRLAMMWLTDPDTGEVFERYADDYVLTGATRRGAIEETEEDHARAFSNAAPAA